MRLLVLTIAGHASGRLRIEQYLPALETEGAIVDRIAVASPSLRPSDLIRVARALRSADVVFVQRIASLPLCSLLRSSGARVIYDVDDALHFVRRSQLAWTSRPRTLRERAVVRYRQLVRGSRYHGSRFNALRQIVGLADATIFGNSFLVDQLGHWAQRIVTLPTCVPVEARPPKVHSQDLPIRIGWIGTGDNLPELDLIEQPLARLAQRFGDGVVLTVVSSRPYDTSAIQTEFDSWSLQTERASVLNFDIGIMPLADTPYTRGKCAFKAVQCMAQALPVVVSPVGLNADLVRDGINGFLANSSDMWLARLSELIQDLGLRTRLGQAAFEDVRAGYSTNFALPVLRDAIGLSVTGKTRR